MKVLVSLYAAVALTGIIAILVFMEKVSEPEEHWHPLNFVIAVMVGGIWPALPLLFIGLWVYQKIIKYAPWAMGSMFEGEDAEDDE